MRRRTAFNLIVPLLLAFALAGCATTPEGKSFQGNATLIFAHNSFQAAARAGQLDDRAQVTIGRALKVAGNALRRYDDAVDAGEPALALDFYLDTFDDALDAVEASLPALLANDLKAERKKHPRP